MMYEMKEVELKRIDIYYRFENIAEWHRIST